MPARPSPPAQAAQAATPKPAHPQDQPAQLESFRIHCFHYGDVFVALTETALPQHRFFLDVALAMNGFRKAERRDLVFDWPQPGVTEGGGERSFRAFFGHQTRAGGRTLIVGARVAALLGHAAPAAACRLDDHVYVGTQVRSAEQKRKLWQLIREH